MTCQDKTMSVWLQALGEFFWVFVMNEANDLEVYKIMGGTEMIDDKAVGLLHALWTMSVCWSKPNKYNQKTPFSIWSRAKFCPGQATFLCYGVKPVPVKYGRFSTWSIKSGLFAKDCVWSMQSSWMFIKLFLNVLEWCRRAISTMPTSCSWRDRQIHQISKPHACTCGDAWPTPSALRTCWRYRPLNWWV